jgi:hypothetical protein
LYYQAEITPTLTYDAGTKVMTNVHRRYIDNFSGAEITVKETALYADLKYYYANDFVYMFSRDLLGTPAPVSAGSRMVVQYTFTITYPA